MPHSGVAAIFMKSLSLVTSPSEVRVRPEISSAYVNTIYNYIHIIHTIIFNQVYNTVYIYNYIYTYVYIFTVVFGPTPSIVTPQTAQNLLNSHGMGGSAIPCVASPLIFGWLNLPPSCIIVFFHLLSVLIYSTYSGWWFGTWLLFSHILGMSSSQLTFIFFRGVETINQYVFICLFVHLAGFMFNPYIQDWIFKLLCSKKWHIYEPMYNVCNIM